MNESSMIALIAAGYSEEDVVKVTGSTHQAVRTALHRMKRPLPILTPGARAEIYEAHQGRQLEPNEVFKLAKAYVTSTPAIHSALTLPPQRIDTAKPPLSILRTMVSTMTVEEIAAHCAVPARRVQYWINNMPHLTTFLSEQDREEINIALDKGTPQADIARRYGVTPQRISQLNRNKKEVKARKLGTPWDELLRRYHVNNETVAHLAKAYDVSKTAIYRRIREC